MSGVRRLRHPQGGAAHARRDRGGAGADGLRLGDRLRRAVPLLPGDLRLSRYPWPGARHRHGDQAEQSGPGRLGGLRRRRRALHRRQPSPARAPAQRRPADPAVQQRDLRPDQGPVLAHLAGRHALALDAQGLARLSGLAGAVCLGLGSTLRCPLGRHPADSPAAGPQAGARAQGRLLRRDLPELHRLQRRRVRRVHRARGGSRCADPRRARQAAHFRARPGQGPAAQARQDGA